MEPCTHLFNVLLVWFSVVAGYNFLAESSHFYFYLNVYFSQKSIALLLFYLTTMYYDCARWIMR